MLKNIKVVELASVLAGPLVGSFFAELGAEVIKIENKTTNGDVTRQWRLPKENKEKENSAYYIAANFGKKPLFVDLKNKEERRQVLALIKKADIVIVNFKAGVAQKLQMSFDQLIKINSTLIYGEITGFGEEKKRAAFDVVLQAETGFMSMNGEENKNPVKMPVALIDVLAAHQLKEGLLLALLNKKNKAQKVSVSLYDTAISSLINQATNWLEEKHIAQPMGARHPNIAPYGDMYKTKDGRWLVLAIGNNKQFVQFCQLAQREELVEDGRFKSNPLRVKNRIALSKEIKGIIGNKKGCDLSALFIDKGIPFGIVKNMKEVFENTRAQELIIQDENGRRVKTFVAKIKER